MTQPTLIQSLSTLPLDEVDYNKIKEFCQQQHEEDLDLDYKADFPNDLDRVLCAFANTQGGVLLIGVAEEGKTRRPVCPPVGREGDVDVSRQRVLSSAFDGVYPALEPEVSAIAVPDTSRHILLVRVSQSSLLHATDRRSRIYIRSKDNNRGYALADFHQLQWLWDKRQASVDLRNSLLESARADSQSQAIPFTNSLSREQWIDAAHLVLSIVPVFPRAPIVSGPRDLLDLVNSLSAVASTSWKEVDRRIPWQDGHWRTTANSVCLSDRGFHYVGQFVELGTYGQILFDFLIHKQPVHELSIPTDETGNGFYAYVVLSSLDIAVRYAARVYERLAFRHPITMHATLAGVANLHLCYNWPGSTNLLGVKRLSLACPDELIELVDLETFGDSLDALASDPLPASARSLVWSFGLGWEEAKIAEWLGRHRKSKSA